MQKERIAEYLILQIAVLKCACLNTSFLTKTRQGHFFKAKHENIYD